MKLFFRYASEGVLVVAAFAALSWLLIILSVLANG